MSHESIDEWPRADWAWALLGDSSRTTADGSRQASALLEALPPLARTMVGVALVSGLRRGELFALRWRDVDEQSKCLTVSEAVYEGAFSTLKTAAGHR